MLNLKETKQELQTKSKYFWKS